MRLERGRHLFGAWADGVPNAVKLPPDDIIKAAEEAGLDGQLAGVYLVRLPQLLDARVHEFGDGVVNLCHRRRHVHLQLDHLLKTHSYFDGRAVAW